MSYPNLQRFLAELERRGELLRVTEPVSHELEITEIADRMVKRGGPALLFENIPGKDFPLAIGLYGTRDRMALALGVDSLDDIADRIRSLIDVKIGGGLIGLASNLPKLRELTSLPPKRVRKGPVQEVIWRGDEVDLSRLPVLKCWPGDGGPFITLPLVTSKDPDSGDVNVGMYRMQVYDKKTTGMHWQRHKTGARHLANAKKLGQKLDVAVALGGDPALTYAATAPLPPIPGINEYSLTGFLRGRSIELCKGVTVDLDVPAEAEFVLEGYIDPDEPWRLEGPFGDHTGFYTLQDLYPVFHVTAITMRKDPVYPATIVGRPPMEDAYLIEASERIFLVPAQLLLPELKDYHLPPAGIAHNLVNIVIDKEYPGQAYKVANGLLGLGQMMFAKVLLVSDEDVKPHQHLDFWRTVLKNAVPGRDSQFAKGPIDVLDHASRAWSYGSKLIIDGTRKHLEEGDEVFWSPNPERSEDELPRHAEIDRQHQIAGGFWFITTTKDRPGQGRHLGEWAAQQPQADGVRLIAVLDHQTDPTDFEDCIWTLLNNIDPERDVMVYENPFEDGGVEGPIFIMDGTPKLAEEGFSREWPDKITMSDAVKARVDTLMPKITGDEVGAEAAEEAEEEKVPSGS
ncbi:MAG: menaquinone biosynthesis decarboxylase [Trueperaceae bacterium]|nr:menaquinone biosynthesis decarboxylase [Trueperaceae bacterium]